ncbi:hypothetical protein [Pyxidicoccus parkwayensis]|uniref:hypothetical protein n=1 Tax=Pyxidicoccus parkwayensis TaxID=2813578 RepID=UPI001F50DBA7|nr:hypothetical protein [Pyxidicoccus parkwaysis]
MGAFTAILAIVSVPSTAHAAGGATCEGGNFRVILPGGQTFSARGGYKVKASNLANGSVIQVRGKYIDYDVNVSTFAVYNYTLTGAAGADDMTGGVRTPLFTSKEPAIANNALDSGDLDIRLDTQSIELRRDGRNIKMKIQAKDCSQGGIFQMEPEIDAGGTIVFTHVLAPGIYYYVNPYTLKVNFGNSAMVVGKDSPQVATKTYQDDFKTVWSVTAGGRMGGVLGEDAVESSPSATSCPQDCQAQNQIHGSVDVLDPRYDD